MASRNPTIYLKFQNLFLGFRNVLFSVIYAKYVIDISVARLEQLHDSSSYRYTIISYHRNKLPNYLGFTLFPTLRRYLKQIF